MITPALPASILEKVMVVPQLTEQSNPDLLRNNNIKLIQAVKDSDMLAIMQLVKQGADPFFKDQINCSAMDYAVYGNQQNYLPILLGKEIKKVDLSFLDRLNSNGNKGKDYREIFQEVGKLSDKKELKFSNVDQLKERLVALHEMALESGDKFQYKEVYKNYIILAACYATPEILTELMESGIPFDKVLDASGRSLLHYTALIAPKNFHLLVQHGLNLNQLSSGKVSPTDLLIVNIQAKDPLAIGFLSMTTVMKVAMTGFMLFAIPDMLRSYETNLYEPLELLYIANSLQAFVQAVSTHYEIALSLYKNPTVANLKSLLPQLFPYLLALPAMVAPIGILPLNVLNIYYLAKNTFQGIKGAWQHSSYRPFKATLAAFMHAANMGVNSMSIIYSTIRALDDPFNEKSHQRRQETEDKYEQQQREYEQKYEREQREWARQSEEQHREYQREYQRQQREWAREREEQHREYQRQQSERDRQREEQRNQEYERRRQQYQKANDDFWEKYNERFNKGGKSNSGSDDHSYGGSSFGNSASYSQVKNSLKTVLQNTNKDDCSILGKVKANFCYDAIQKLNSVASVDAMQKACKKLKVMFHPDKLAKYGEQAKEAAGRIFQELNGAKAGNCDSKMY